jgi:aspartyl protease
MADRPWRAELRLDGQSWLPKSLTGVGATGVDVVEYSRYLEHEGRKVAGMVTTRTGEIPWFQGRVTAIRSAPADADRVFAPIERRPEDTQFDPSGPARVRLERARTGHLLVHPTINGVQVGAFVFDSGAAVTVIAPEAAAKLGLPTVGRAPLPSMFGTVAAKVDRVGTLGLGPVRISGVNLVEMDLAPLNAAFGRRVEGIIGYELFSRCVVDLTLAEDALTLHDPKASGLEGLRWLLLSLPARHPAVAAKAAEVPEGLFRVDLGAAGGPAGNVTFHSSAVRAHHLLDGRQVVRVQAGNLHLGLGEIPWFELAGHRFERPAVMFALDDEGVLGEVGTLGNIGVEFLRPFRVVFDYPHSRIAFIERAGGSGGR